jgi:hypothetical protein
VGRKGGKVAGVDALPEAAGQCPHAIGAVVEALGSRLHGQLFHKDGAEDFVLAMQGIRRLQEDRAVAGAVHDEASKCGVFFQQA